MVAIDQRIKLARQRMGLSKSALSRILGVTPTSCISWELPESDRNSARPNVENLTHLAVVCSVRFDWLANGSGAMTYDGDKAAAAGDPVIRKKQLPPDQRLLLELFKHLPPGKQDAVMELLNDLRAKRGADS